MKFKLAVGSKENTTPTLFLRATSFNNQRRQLEEAKEGHYEVHLNTILQEHNFDLHSLSFFQGMEEEFTKLKAEVAQLQERLRISEEARAALEQENRGLQEQVTGL